MFSRSTVVCPATLRDLIGSNMGQSLFLVTSPRPWRFCILEVYTALFIWRCFAGYQKHFSLDKYFIADLSIIIFSYSINGLFIIGLCHLLVFLLFIFHCFKYFSPWLDFCVYNGMSANIGILSALGESIKASESSSGVPTCLKLWGGRCGHVRGPRWTWPHTLT